MRRNWRGRYKNNWHRSNKSVNKSVDNHSINNLSSSTRINSSAGTSRAPVNQLPIVVPLNSENNVWKLYFPSEGNLSINSNTIKYLPIVSGLTTLRYYVLTYIHIMYVST